MDLSSMMDSSKITTIPILSSSWRSSMREESPNSSGKSFLTKISPSASVTKLVRNIHLLLSLLMSSFQERAFRCLSQQKTPNSLRSPMHAKTSSCRPIKIRKWPLCVSVCRTELPLLWRPISIAPSRMSTIILRPSVVYLPSNFLVAFLQNPSILPPLYRVATWPTALWSKNDSA